MSHWPQNGRDYEELGPDIENDQNLDIEEFIDYNLNEDMGQYLDGGKVKGQALGLGLNVAEQGIDPNVYPIEELYLNLNTHERNDPNVAIDQYFEENEENPNIAPEYEWMWSPPYSPPLGVEAMDLDLDFNIAAQEENGDRRMDLNIEQDNGIRHDLNIDIKDDIEAPDIGEQEEENSLQVRSESGMDRITPLVGVSHERLIQDRRNLREKISTLKKQNSKSETEISSSMYLLLRMSKLEKNQKKALNLKQRIGDAQRKINYNNYYIDLYQNAMRDSINYKDIPEKKKFDIKLLNEEEIDFFMEQTENNVRDLEIELATIVGKYSRAQDLAKETENEEELQRLKLKLKKLKENYKYNEYLLEIVGNTLRTLKEIRDEGEKKREKFRRKSKRQTLMSADRYLRKKIEQNLNEFISNRSELNANELRNRMREIGELHRRVIENDYSLRINDEEMVEKSRKGVPDLEEYAQCLERMINLMLEYQKGPNQERIDEIETELIYLQEIREENEKKFKKYKYSEKVLGNLLRRKLTKQEKESDIERNLKIENMNENELEFFREETEHYIDSLLNRMANNLALIRNSERQLQSLKNIESRAKYHNQLDQNQIEYEYNRALLDISYHELQRIIGRLIYFRESMSSAHSQRQPFRRPRPQPNATPVPEILIPTLRELVDYFHRTGFPFQLNLMPIDWRPQIDALEVRQRRKYIRKIIKSLKKLLRHIQRDIVDAKVNPGRANVGGILIDEAICKHLVEREKDILGYIELWEQEMDRNPQQN